MTRTVSASAPCRTQLAPERTTMTTNPRTVTTAEDEQLLTPAEVAAMFRVDPKTVTRWAKAGKLSSIRTLGGHRRYRASEVARLRAGIPGQRTEPHGRLSAPHLHRRTTRTTSASDRPVFPCTGRAGASRASRGAGGPATSTDDVSPRRP